MPMSREIGALRRGAAALVAAVLLASASTPVSAIERKGRIRIVGTISYESNIPARTEILVDGSATVVSPATVLIVNGCHAGFVVQGRFSASMALRASSR